MEGNEILAVVDSVSNEKGLDKDSIFEAIELAIASASQRHFHEDAELYVKIDRVSGEYSTFRNWNSNWIAIRINWWSYYLRCLFWRQDVSIIRNN